MALESRQLWSLLQILLQCKQQFSLMRTCALGDKGAFGKGREPLRPGPSLQQQMVAHRKAWAAVSLSSAWKGLLRFPRRGSFPSSRSKGSWLLVLLLETHRSSSCPERSLSPTGPGGKGRSRSLLCFDQQTDNFLNWSKSGFCCQMALKSLLWQVPLAGHQGKGDWLCTNK